MTADAGDVLIDDAGEAVGSTPVSRRRGIGVCLSGGGFRATLFQAGALLRLHELGITTREDIATVASVSGGSIAAAQWAVAVARFDSLQTELVAQRPGKGGAEPFDSSHTDLVAQGPVEGASQGPMEGEAQPFPSTRSALPHLLRASDSAPFDSPQTDLVAQGPGGVAPRPVIDFRRDVVGPIEALTSRDIRTGAMARKFLMPWNWFRGAYAVDAMVDRFEEVFGKGTLDLLPLSPRFVFCATDMSFGVNFVFSRERVGSYLAGYAPPKDFTLAQAVAASACIPPLFGPMRIANAETRFKGGALRGADKRKAAFADLRVSDGGVYDNLGLEPVWKSHRVVFACDAGGLMDPEADQSFFWRIKRYQAIQETQARATRKRYLLSGYRQETLGGAYVGVGSAVSSYDKTAADDRSRGYSKDFALSVIRTIRTDLDAFSEVERGVLMNHGYSLIDAAVRRHTPDLASPSAAAFVWPSPAFAPGAVSEDELRKRLAGSSSRKTTGRR